MGALSTLRNRLLCRRVLAVTVHTLKMVSRMSSRMTKKQTRPM
jgi:hypothetical protein